MIGLLTGWLKNLWPMLLLAGALLATGYLLKESYKTNGQLSAQVEQWQAANEAWSESWQQRELEFNKAQERLAKRDADYQRIEGELNDYQEKLRTILRDSDDAGCGVRPSIWMLIKDSAAGNATGTVSGD